jgi:enediyne biosynthesis protein E3
VVISPTVRRFLAIDADEATFAKRGFREGDQGIRKTLEEVGAHFLEGYGVALSSAGDSELGRRLDDRRADLRGFAYEGAAMALGLLDGLAVGRGQQWAGFLARHPEHVYMIHVGLGWAWARLLGCSVRRAGYIRCTTGSRGMGTDSTRGTSTPPALVRQPRRPPE